MFAKNVAAVLVVQALVLCASALGQTVNPLRVIADTDTLVPGGAGQNFQTFFQLDGVDPDISGRHVVFMACCPTGIYSWFNGELRTIVDLNTTFPESGKLLGFVLGSSPSVSGNNVAFFCTHGRPGPGALCAVIDGRLELIAEFGVTLVPGSDETFRFWLGTSPSISGKNVAFPGGGATDNGIYARIDGELVIIADSTTPVPGQPGLVFKNFGQLGGSSPSISGRNVAFVGMWSDGSGVYARIDGELREIASTAMALPPGSSPICAGFFGSFGPQGGNSPSISGGTVVFRTICGLYRHSGGPVELVADTDTVAPESPGTFGGFPASPVVSGQNIVVGSAAEGLGPAIFARTKGVFEVIASENTTTVPGHDDTTFTSFLLGDDSDGVRPSISGENVVFFGEAVLPLQHHVFGIYGRIIDPPIPATSAWLLAAFALVVVGLGASLIVRRRRIVREL